MSASPEPEPQQGRKTPSWSKFCKAHTAEYRMRWSADKMAIIAFLKRNEAHLQCLDLGNNNLGDKAATHIAEALERNKTVTEVRLHSNNIGDEGSTHLSEIFTKNRTITLLDLRDNLVCPTGAHHLSAALTKISCRLKTLNLHNNRLEDEGAWRLAQALDHNKTLTCLDLGRNNLVTETVTQPRTDTALPSPFATRPEAISTASRGGSSDRPAMRLIRRLAEALEKNSSLLDLSLYRNFIGATAGRHLAEALGSKYAAASAVSTSGAMQGRGGCQYVGNKTLMTLNLYGNDLGDRGAEALAMALRVNATLTHVHLGGNEITCKGCVKIGQALDWNNRLQRLYLTSNRIRCRGAKRLAVSLMRNKSLKVVFVDWNKIGVEGMAALQGIVGFN